MIIQRQLRKRLPLFFIKVCTKLQFYDIITMYMCNLEIKTNFSKGEKYGEEI